MTRIGKIVVAAPFVATAIGCSGSLPEIPADLTAELGEVVVESPFQNTAPGWAIGGTARLIDIPRFSSMQVQVDVRGLTPGPHAWHIHTGGCRNPGGIVVPFTPIGAQAGIDEPLTAGENGQVTQDAIIPAELLTPAQVQAGEYSLHVHNSAGANPGRSIGCAEM